MANKNMAFSARRTSKISKKSHAKRWWVAAGGVVVLVALVAVLEFSHTIHLFHTDNTAATHTIVQRGKQPSPAKNNSSATSSPAKTSAPGTTRSIGGANDTNGSGSSSTPASQWTTSQSGEITVKQPVANDTIQDGAVLSGSAKVGQVYFNLIDDQVGVIAQGSLNVVNGDFSGTLHFTPHSTSGRLDIYSTTTPGGPELNLVEIAVHF